MERKDNTTLIIIVVMAVAVLAFGGYLAWQQFKIPPPPPPPAAPTTATVSLGLTQAYCGNWQYLNATDPPEWISKKTCVSALQQNDGNIFEIKQGATGQSVAQLSFSLPSNIDASKIISLDGEILGACRRQFEIKTLTQYKEWRPLPSMQCPPDYLDATDFTFTPDIHNGTVGVLIVSGDNFNDLKMDQVSIKATYAISTSTAQ